MNLYFCSTKCDYIAGREGGRMRGRKETGQAQTQLKSFLSYPKVKKINYNLTKGRKTGAGN